MRKEARFPLPLLRLVILTLLLLDHPLGLGFLSTLICRRSYVA